MTKLLKATSQEKRKEKTLISDAGAAAALSSMWRQLNVSLHAGKEAETVGVRRKCNTSPTPWKLSILLLPAFRELQRSIIPETKGRLLLAEHFHFSRFARLS